MRLRRYIWILFGLLLLAGAWLLWHPSGRQSVDGKAAVTAPVTQANSTGVAPLTNPALVSAAAAKTNRLAYRLSNTTRTIGQLTGDRRAILLENALIDSSLPVNFTFPKNLLAQGDPGAYIVQSRGPINAAFRALLARSGAEIISYIPNDAYLVRLTAGGAGALAAQPPVQSVIPYEPYYKLQLSLLGPAVNQSPLPAGAVLTLGLFANDAPQTISAIEKLGGTILSRDASPFGPVVRVRPPADWTALAALPGVQIVETYHPRVPANDLSRVTVGVATNTLASSSNYMNLDGKNVMVAVPDTGIDATHPDFTTGGSAAGGAGGAPVRVIGDAVQSLVDTNGHGTHVAGIIAGNGAKSYTTMSNGILQMAEGSVTNADFRGMAPMATLYSMAGINGGADTNIITDRYLQEQAALTNALISNNSWSYGNNGYDLAAAIYDWGTRDSLPKVTGSQPVLFVFAAGNDGHVGLNGGGGDNNGGSVTPDTISSPGTAKDVITVAALEQMRNIADPVTNLDGSVSRPWQPETDTGYQVAFYSSRGNVGVGIEGPNGRLKPDVAAPGTFVVSTRSSQWATNGYYNPTNHDDNTYTGQSVGPNGINYYSLFVPQNAVSVTVQIQANKNSPTPMPDLPIYVSQYNFPDPTDPTSYDFVVTNEVLIPPDGPGNYLNTIQGTGFNYAVGNPGSQTVNYNLFTEVATTNDLGNYFQVLEGMNDGLGGFYRYESGTSMAAADVSGTLALIQDFFTNQLQMTPSPALLKAMLINGARPTLPFYNMRVGNPINNEGWGLINLPNSLPTNAATSFIASGSTPATMFIQDQSTTNALATGDSHTFTITISSNAPAAPLRLTLTWTDPPGDPVAAIKLVNSLELVVTNLDNPTNPVVYYGNDISANGFNTAEYPTNMVSVDTINNVQNVFIPQPVGSNYTVTVIGREVNVTAVSAQTNLYAGPPNGAGVYAPNVVQDYALVISCGDAFTVVDNGIVSNPTADQNITSLLNSTNTANTLSGQFVGANSPVLNTNIVSFTSNTAFGGSAVDTLGTTNQWHFYVVTNNGATSDYTNAAFVIYSSKTLSIPRMGVFADSLTNATLPSANIDLYATTDPTLTNLNPVAISDCVNGVVNGPSAASLDRGGDKFIVFSNSAPGDVYYIGVKSEDQMASEYSFLSVFSNVPFDQNDNGDEILTGLTIPAPIPGGNPSVPGFIDVVAIAVRPVQAASVIVTNVIQQTDVGDLVSSLTFNNTTAVLMNHDSPNTAGTFGYVCDDSGTVDPALTPLPNTYQLGGATYSLTSGYNLQHADGPGSLRDFIGQNVSSGVWVFHLANSVEPFTGNLQLFNLRIRPQLPLTSGVTNTIPGHGVFRDFVDVPAGETNLTINATNITPSPDTVNPLLMTIKFGSEPTLLNADKGPVPLINGTAVGSGGAGLGNSLSVGPTDVPPIQPGRYYVDITNQSATAQTVFVIAVILPPNPSGTTTDFASANSTQILDDAVSYSDIFVTNTLPIVSVNVGIEVQHARISDLVFHLISPDGTRVLLMENRGGADPNGAGISVLETNVTATGAMVTVTNSLAGVAAGEYASSQTVAGWTVNTNQVSVVNDPLNATQGSNLLALASGTLSTTIATIPGQTYSVTLPYRGPGIAGWWRAESNALDSINGNNGTLMGAVTNYSIVWSNGFEGNFTADYVTNQVVAGWTVNSNQVSLVTDANNAWHGSNFLALASGVISTNIPTVVGQTYTLTFAYRGPGIAGWWRGENGTNDSINGNNPIAVNNITISNGEVSKAFYFDGSSSYITVPASTSLAVSNLTFEGWIYPTTSQYEPIIDYGGASQVSPVHFWLNGWGLSPVPGMLYANTRPSNITMYSAGGIVPQNTWSHVAFSLNITTGAALIYYDGFLVASNYLTPPVAVNSTFVHVNLGYRDAASSEALAGYRFAGGMDEISIYNRALSAGEIKAIYARGTAGKYDPAMFFISPASSLAEVRVKLNGQSQIPIYGNNTNWQIYSNTFTATTNQTLLSITGLQPGILLDEFVLTTNVVTGAPTYTNGEVAQAFSLNGTTSYVSIPDAPLLDSFTSRITVDCWIKNNLLGANPLWDWIVTKGNSSWRLMGTQGANTITFYGSGLANGSVMSSTRNVNDGQWHHVVGTYDGADLSLFVDGTLDVAQPNTGLILQNNNPMEIGQNTGAPGGNIFNGLIDEVSIYSRSLSASEIKAIYQTGTNGKFDPVTFNTSPAQSLAEAQFSLTGQSTSWLYGSNTAWQTYTATFKAVTNQTKLTVAGVEPGVLMGPLLISSPVLVTNVVTNNYYLTFTEDTNLTTTPIKFAPPPFVPPITTPTILLTNGFEQTPAGDYAAVQTFGNGWIVTSNQVSVVTDPVNAYEGSNYLALAGGTILTNLPTVAGNTYTLTFAYRGPGIASMWRAESNVNDSIGANNGTLTNGAGFAPGEVGQAFSFDGTSYASIPDSPSLDGFSNRITLEAWVKVNQFGGGWDGILTKGNSSWELRRYSNASTAAFTTVGLSNQDLGGNKNINDGQWHHVAGVYDGTTKYLYVDGALDASALATGTIMQNSYPLFIGGNAETQGNLPGYFWNGWVDEASIYSRALTASEINAIYAKGGAGKYDPSLISTSPALSLAEAQVSLNGQVQATLNGSNTVWQVETITFTATQDGTPLQISGIEPGMLLDDFVLTAEPGNLYYLPEQSLGAFTGKSAYGDWQLEIQDDRAGAGLTNVLASWELQFVFANTNAVPAVLSGGIGQSNQFIPAGYIAWYQISVPASANYATNILQFASAPVNVWFSTNVPPTITNPGDVDLIPNSTAGSMLLSTTNPSDNNLQPPPNISANETYYLGVQNTNSFTVNYGIEVDFDHGNATNSGLPALVIRSVKASGSGTTMQWTASPSAQFQMQWTDDLAQPWNTDTNVITSSDGNFSFTDDGSQTGPLGTQRFYRLVQIAP